MNIHPSARTSVRVESFSSTGSDRKAGASEQPPRLLALEENLHSRKDLPVLARTSAEAFTFMDAVDATVAD